MERSPCIGIQMRLPCYHGTGGLIFYKHRMGFLVRMRCVLIWKNTMKRTSGMSKPGWMKPVKVQPRS